MQRMTFTRRRRRCSGCIVAQQRCRGDPHFCEDVRTALPLQLACLRKVPLLQLVHASAACMAAPAGPGEPATPAKRHAMPSRSQVEKALNSFVLRKRSYTHTAEQAIQTCVDRFYFRSGPSCTLCHSPGLPTRHRCITNNTSGVVRARSRLRSSQGMTQRLLIQRQ